MNQLVESIDSEGEEKYYYYDTWGNLSSDGKAEYSYDHLNRLKEYRPFGVSDGTHYTYYIDNLRKSKDDTYFIWLDGNMVYEFTSSDSDTYTYGHRLLYSDDVKYVLNAHGDVVALLNNSGVVTKRYDYDAFGNELGIDNTDTNPFRYFGEYFDVETGQIYLRARYYSPVTGRFIQIDPILDGLNWYAYCTNNPIIFIDPAGTDAIIITNENSVNLGVGSAGHTSLLVQDSDGNWYYTYWGKEAAAVIQLPDDIVRYTSNGEIVESTMSSMGNFNSALNDLLSFYGLNNITKDYTAATYVTGDFTKSLEQAYQDVNDASNHRGSDGTVLTFDDKKTIVYQGNNGDYCFWVDNCLQRSISAFGKGTLSNNINAGDYLFDNGFYWGLIPNLAQRKFENIFGNSSFTYYSTWQAPAAIRM